VAVPLLGYDERDASKEWQLGIDLLRRAVRSPLVLVRPLAPTTPAGRFQGEIGRNMRGEDVLWVDYEAAVSMHRVITTNPEERRLQRLASPQVSDNRISYGCINVPVAFFERVLMPASRAGAAPVVYVLPEVRPLREVFLRLPAARTTALAQATNGSGSTSPLGNTAGRLR
jgi:hypothetical protein